MHRWVYGDAAEYFDPYDEEELAHTIARTAQLSRDDGHLAAMRERGLRHAKLYTAEALAPHWEAAILRLAASRHRVRAS